MTTPTLRRAPPPPADLTERAAAQWRQLAPRCIAAGTLTTASLPALAVLCRALAAEALALETLEREGLTLPTAGGGRKGHPAARVLREARATAVALLADFGLAPPAAAAFTPWGAT